MIFSPRRRHLVQYLLCLLFFGLLLNALLSYLGHNKKYIAKLFFNTRYVTYFSRGKPIIWMFWANNFDEMPAFVRLSMASIVCHNQHDFELILLQDGNVAQYIPDLHPLYPYLIPAHKADYIRANILNTYGGIYIDVDSIGINSFRHLYDQLEDYELVNIDWTKDGDIMAVGILGPMRSKSVFTMRWSDAVKMVLDNNFDHMPRQRNPTKLNPAYPIKWAGLLRDVVKPIIGNLQNTSSIKFLQLDGASTYGQFILSGKKMMERVAFMPGKDLVIEPTEALMYGSSLLSDSIRSAPLDRILNSDCVLAELIRLNPAYPIKWAGLLRDVVEPIIGNLQNTSSIKFLQLDGASTYGQFILSGKKMMERVAFMPGKDLVIEPTEALMYGSSLLSDSIRSAPLDRILNSDCVLAELIRMENLTSGVAVTQVANPPLDVSAQVIPDPEAQERLLALQELYQQKQADLIASFQQAQVNLAKQHYLYFQQAIAKSNEVNRNEQQQQPHPLSQSSSVQDIQTAYTEDRERLAVSESVARLVAARSQPHLQSAMRYRLAQSLQQHVHERLAASDVRLPPSHVSTMSMGNLGNSGNSQAPSLLNANMRCNSSSGAISDRTRERLRAVLFHKQTQKSQTNLNASLGGSQPIKPRPMPRPSNQEQQQPMMGQQTGNGQECLTDVGHSLREYQLRKVCSEPNLKMRPPHRNKLSRSPPYTIPESMSSSQTNVNSAFKPPLNINQTSNNQQTNLVKGHSLSFPSPSLPNLPVRESYGQHEKGTGTPQAHAPPLDIYAMSQMLAQQGYGYGFGAQQLLMSMPSLLNSNPNLALPFNVPPMAHSQTHLNPLLSTAVAERLRALDPRLSLSGHYASGPRDASVVGGKSVLKQQLRDLVLRRKSLVREETDDEIATIRANLNLVVSASALGSNQIPLRTGIAYDSAMCKHVCVCKDNKQHVEHGGRTHSIYARLQERGLLDGCEKIVGRKASLDQLKLVHSETYVTFFAISPTACLKVDPSKLPLRSFVQLPCGGIGVDTDTYFNDACTQSAARLAVGYLTELVTQVWEGRLRNGYAIIRPPGHHAERDLAMGFCFFNNVAIAVKTLMMRPNAPTKVAIVDWDVHHGNGTQLAFENSDQVLYLSIHRHDNGNFFPGTGAVTDCGTHQGRGFNVNIAWTGGSMGDAEYLAAWRVVMCPVLAEFQPDIIVVSAGFDAALGHPVALGGYRVSPQMFGYLTTQLCRFANGKVVLALEGGYDLASICDSSEECLKSLCVASSPAADEAVCCSKLSQEALLSRPSMAAQETLQKVVAVQKKFWSRLTGDGLRMNQVEWEASSNGVGIGQLSLHSNSPARSAPLSETRSPIRVDDSPAFSN